jgi:hypothetical protein
MTTLTHPFFGNVTFAAADEIDEYGDLCDIDPVRVRGQLCPSSLYYTRANLDGLTSQTLDPLAALAKRIDQLDDVARRTVPAALSENWLRDHSDPEMWGSKITAQRALEKLQSIFPGKSSLDLVSPAEFAAALTLEAVSFSLAPDNSGGASMTLDYRILPDDLSDDVIAAKFSADGRLLSIDVEG